MLSNPSTHRPQKRFSQIRLVFAGLFILLTGCNLPTSAISTPIVPTPIVITVMVPVESTPAPQATNAPQATIPAPTSAPDVTAAIPQATSTTGVACTVQQDLNLRSGPGTAYDPPIASLKAGTQLAPSGYNPQGVPGGAWVQVQVKGTAQTGWVSAGPQYVSCNLELASLPAVDVPPPPKPAAPQIGTGAVDGNGFDLFRFSLDFNPAYFMRMYVFRSDNPDEKFAAKKDGRNITSVEFTVTSLDGSVTYYDRTEKNAGYCIFGGGEPDCNPWIFENGRYRWKSGGDPLQPGDYQMTITVTSDDNQVGVWFWDDKNPVTITLP